MPSNLLVCQIHHNLIFVSRTVFIVHAKYLDSGAAITQLFVEGYNQFATTVFIL